MTDLDEILGAKALRECIPHARENAHLRAEIAILNATIADGSLNSAGLVKEILALEKQLREAKRAIVCDCGREKYSECSICDNDT